MSLVTSQYTQTKRIKSRFGNHRDRVVGSGFDKDGQFVPQHLRGPDVTLFRGQFRPKMPVVAKGRSSSSVSPVKSKIFCSIGK